MKKILPIILIVLISLNTFGFDFILGYLFYNCKNNFKDQEVSSLAKNEIKVFKLSQLEKNKLQMFEDEIKYDGHMYDIVKKEKKNDDIYIYCFSDFKEDHLNALINAKNNEQSNPSKVNFIQKDLTKNYLPPQKIEGILNPDFAFISNLESANYSSYVCDVLYPPPNFLI